MPEQIDGANVRLEDMAFKLRRDFSEPHPQGIGKIVMLKSLLLSYDTNRLILNHKTEAEKLENFASHPLDSGNPDIEIFMYGRKTGQVAIYNYDSCSGLTVVNDFEGIKPDEVRPLTEDDRQALRFSFATPNIANLPDNKALTPDGVDRLAADLYIAYSQQVIAGYSRP